MHPACARSWIRAAAATARAAAAVAAAAVSATTAAAAAAAAAVIVLATVTTQHEQVCDETLFPLAIAVGASAAVCCSYVRKLALSHSERANETLRDLC